MTLLMKPNHYLGELFASVQWFHANTSVSEYKIFNFNSKTQLNMEGMIHQTSKSAELATKIQQINADVLRTYFKEYTKVDY